MNLPTYEHDVKAAAVRLKGHATQTPVLTSRTVDAELDAQVFFKCENFQRTGSFKFRGAFNSLSCLVERGHRGVITFSSGNHAQAVALAARLLQIPATIIMPSDAPLSKLEATRAYGGHVVTYDRYRENRESLTAALAAEHQLAFIHPYDHADTIAGQGTATAELIQEVGPLDSLYVCVGGGGLLSGAALAAKALSPDCKVYGVEPEAGNDGQQSFRTGSIVRIEVPKSIADGAQTQYLGSIGFQIIRRDVSDMLTVPDADLIAAMRFFATRMKIVVEPTGCLAVAAVRARGASLAGQRIGVIISGGNVDAARFAGFLGESALADR